MDNRKWKILFRHFQFVDLQNLYRNTGVQKHSHFYAFLKEILFLAFCLNMVIYWAQFTKTPVVDNMLVVPVVDMCYPCAVTSFITSVVQSFKSSYKEINTKVERISKKPQFFTQIQNLTRNYRNLGESIQIFNSLFGFQMLFLTLLLFVYFVKCCNLILVLIRIDFTKVFMCYFFVSNFLVLGFLTVLFHIN